jgi:hypothetical protein
MIGVETEKSRSTTRAQAIARLAVFCVLALTLGPAQGFASAFGFKVGMTRDQIVAIVGSKALDRTDGDVLTFSTAPEPHGKFVQYMCIISPDAGLLKVAAYSRDITTNAFGDNLKEQFEELEKGVASVYGDGERMDFLMSGSLWSGPRDWMMGLLKEERTLATYWKPNPSPDKITIVVLKATALSTEKGYISLVYEFEGFHAYTEKKKQNQNAVF